MRRRRRNSGFGIILVSPLRAKWRRSVIISGVESRCSMLTIIITVGLEPTSRASLDIILIWPNSQSGCAIRSSRQSITFWPEMWSRTSTAMSLGLYPRRNWLSMAAVSSPRVRRSLSGTSSAGASLSALAVWCITISTYPGSDS